MVTSPLVKESLAPEEILTEPPSPDAAVPPTIETLPPTLLLSRPADPPAISAIPPPLLSYSEVPSPLFSSISPPFALDASDRPEVTSISPPELPVDLPVASSKSPLVSTMDSPVVILIVPLLACVVPPVFILTDPLSPTEYESAVSSVRLPVEEEVLSPVIMVTSPPGAPIGSVVVPAVTETLPP